MRRPATVPAGVPALLLAAVLTTGLAACSSGPEQTTCGEVRGMSDAERADLVRDLADTAGADEPDERAALTAAGRLLEGCQGQPDRTTLDEIEEFGTRG